MTNAQPRTIAIPEARAPEKLIQARSRRHGSAYGCIVCGLPTPSPRFYCHVIEGGGVALHPDDEHLYVPDGGDMCHLPLGSECLRKHPQLKPFAIKA